MVYKIPKTKLSRGRLFGPYYLVVSLLLIIPGASLMQHTWNGGSPLYGVLGVLIAAAAMPFGFRWGDYITGSFQMIHCDKKIIAIRAFPWKLECILAQDVERVACERAGFVLNLKDGHQFRMLHKDVAPQHEAMLKTLAGQYPQNPQSVTAIT